MAAPYTTEAANRAYSAAIIRDGMRQQAEAGHARQCQKCFRCWPWATFRPDKQGKLPAFCLRCSRQDMYSKHCEEVHGEMLQLVSMFRQKRKRPGGGTVYQAPSNQSRPQTISKRQHDHIKPKEQARNPHPAVTNSYVSHREQPKERIQRVGLSSPSVTHPNAILPSVPNRPPIGPAQRPPQPPSQQQIQPNPTSVQNYAVPQLPVKLARLGDNELAIFSQRPDELRSIKEPFRTSFWLQIICQPTAEPRAIAFNLLIKAYLHFLGFPAVRTPNTTPSSPLPIPPPDPPDIFVILRNLWPEIRFSGGITGSEEVFCLGLEFRDQGASRGPGSRSASRSQTQTPAGPHPNLVMNRVNNGPGPHGNGRPHIPGQYYHPGTSHYGPPASASGMVTPQREGQVPHQLEPFRGGHAAGPRVGIGGPSTSRTPNGEFRTQHDASVNSLFSQPPLGPLSTTFSKGPSSL
ncbi:hypothetical protein IAR50_006358 [Cryptococcus sp. DSM 104548]